MRYAFFYPATAQYFIPSIENRGLAGGYGRLRLFKPNNSRIPIPGKDGCRYFLTAVPYPGMQFQRRFGCSPPYPVNFNYLTFG